VLATASELFILMRDLIAIDAYSVNSLKIDEPEDIGQFKEV
jgi:hypothetical protein